MDRLLRSVVVSWLACTTLVGCVELDGAAVSGRELGLAEGDAQLRLVHASATSGAFDIYLGDGEAPRWAAITFASVTDYVAVPAGAVQIAVRPAGAAASTAPLFALGTSLAEGDRVTLVADGVVGSSVEAVKFRVQAVAEAFAPAEPGTLRVRFVQASHALQNAGYDVGADGTVEVAGLAPFATSEPAGLAVPASPKPVQLAVHAGTPNRRLTAFTLPATALTEGEELLVIPTGVPAVVPRDPRGLALLLVGRGTLALVRQNPTLYLLPAIPNAAGVDLHLFGALLGGVQVADEAGFGSLTAVQVPANRSGYGLLALDGAADADTAGAPLAFALTGTLEAGERYLVVASGFRGDCASARPGVQVAVIRDQFATAQTASGRLRAVAAAADAPALDLGRFPPGDNTPFTSIAGLDGLAYGATSPAEGTEIPAVPLNPALRPTGTDTAIRFRFGSLASVDRVLAVIAGAHAPAAGDVGPRLVMVKAANSGAWTAQVVAPPQQ